MKKFLSIVFVALVILMSCVLIFNKTFLKNTYQSGQYEIFIPRFSFLVKTQGAKVGTFISLRSKEKLEKEVNEYLETSTVPISIYDVRESSWHGIKYRTIYIMSDI